MVEWSYIQWTGGPMRPLVVNGNVDPDADHPREERQRREYMVYVEQQQQ
jgi:hypothetical protein